MSEVNEGVVCLYGIGLGQVASLYVQGYSVSSGFNNTGMVVDEQGVTLDAGSRRELVHDP